jgi:hypothetical protein
LTEDAAAFGVSVGVAGVLKGGDAFSESPPGTTAMPVVLALLPKIMAPVTLSRRPTLTVTGFGAAVRIMPLT